MTTICEATKKNGCACKNKSKPNSHYCGVHKDYYLFSKPTIKVYYPCGKSVDVKYKKDIEDFKTQLDEYKTHIITIFIGGIEDEPTEMPPHLESVFCLLSEPRMLKAGYVATKNREDGDVMICTITDVQNYNDLLYRIFFLTRYIRSTDGVLVANAGMASLAINSLHSKFHSNTSLKPEDFVEP
jgi:hypothetical protein